MFCHTQRFPGIQDQHHTDFPDKSHFTHHHHASSHHRMFQPADYACHQRTNDHAMFSGAQWHISSSINSSSQDIYNGRRSLVTSSSDTNTNRASIYAHNRSSSRKWNMQSRKERRLSTSTTSPLSSNSCSSSSSPVVLSSLTSCGSSVREIRIQKRDRANEQERRRMKQINNALDNLRLVLRDKPIPHLPASVQKHRESKIKTLTAAIAYIKFLQQQLIQPWKNRLTRASFSLSSLVSQNDHVPNDLLLLLPDPSFFFRGSFDAGKHTYTQLLWTRYQMEREKINKTEPIFNFTIRTFFFSFFSSRNSNTSSSSSSFGCEFSYYF